MDIMKIERIAVTYFEFFANLKNKDTACSLFINEKYLKKIDNLV